jgi:hypothetical protein
MGISRGFRRLSILEGLVGAGFVGFLFLDSLNDPPTTVQLGYALLTFCAAPVAFVLVLGWVVAGFQAGD